MPTVVPFYLVDVFAEVPLAGNPLALVTDAEGLDEPLLKRIAREFNQSETTFLLPPTDPAATWRLRSFTAAGVEVLGAGHNALGAWWWLAAEGGLPGGRYAQQIGDQVLSVDVVTDHAGGAEVVVMDQAAPAFGAMAADLAAVANALGLSPGDLRADIPARTVDTGAAHLLVPAVRRDAVDRAHPDSVLLRAELHRAGAEGCYLYSLDPVNPEAAAYARFFNPTAGIWEDPATGTAAGPLAAHLVGEGVVAPGRVLIEQGHAMGRPSLLRIDVDGPRVRLSGAGVVVAGGTLRL